MTIFRNWSDILRTSSGSILVTNRRGRHLYKRLNDYIIIRDQDKFSFNKSLTDIITLNDLITNRATFIRVINDNIILNENVTANQFISKLLSDMIDFNDSTQVNAQFNISLTDTLILNDSNLNTQSLNRVVQDTIVFSDLFLNGAFLNKTLNDIVVFNDDFNKISNIIRQLNENIVFNDSISNTLVFNKFIADNITFDDFLTDGAILNKLLNDNVVFSELFSEVQNINRQINDNIIFNDSFQKAVDFNRTIANQLLLNDNFSNVIGINKLLSDVLSFNDNFASVNTMNKTIVDVISLSDSRSTIAQFNRTLADTLNLNDVVTKQAAFNRTLDNNVIFTDSTSRVLGGSGPIYYVATTGSDTTGNGSIGNPWASLYKATSTVSTVGSTIYMLSGSYTESHSCLLQVGVSLMGAGKTSTIIHCTKVDNYTISMYSASVTNGNHEIFNIGFTGDMIGFGAISFVRRSNVNIHDCSFTDLVTTAIYTDNAIPTVTYATGNKVHDCEFVNSAVYSAGGSIGHINIRGQQGFLCYNNTISIPKRGVTPGGFGIKTNYTKGLQIYNNIIDILDNDDNTAWAFAVELWNTSDGCDIYSNEFRGVVNFAGSFTTKGASTYSIRFHDNFVGQNSLQSVARIGIILENQSDMSDVLIYDNTFEHLQTGITFNTLSSSIFNRVSIYRNTFYSIGITANNYWGYAITSNGSAGFTLTNIDIWNNTFVSGRSTNSLVAILLPTSGTTSYIEVKNNIFTDFGGKYISSNTGSTGTIDYVYLQYNDVYNCGGSNEPVWGGITPSNLTKTNIIKVNPLFISTTDFHLQTGSPCINTGIDVGLPYTGSAPDIGAFETT